MDLADVGHAGRKQSLPEDAPDAIQLDGSRMVADADVRPHLAHICCLSRQPHRASLFVMFSNALFGCLLCMFELQHGSMAVMYVQ